MTSPEWDFFIAHASADSSVADGLYALLRNGAKVFLDTKILRLGDEWDRELANAQRSSRITVVLVSPQVENAYYQREEIAAAIGMARDNPNAHRVVPVFLGGQPTNVPYGLRLRHSITITDPAVLEELATKLLELLADVKERDGLGDPHEALLPRPQPPRQPSLTWWPYLSFYPVNRQLASRYLSFAGLLTAISAGVRVAARLQAAPDFATLMKTANLALPMMWPALIYSGLGLALVVAIRATILDMQIILSLARGFLLLATIYICCAAALLLGAEMTYWAKGLLLFLVLLGVFAHITGGLSYYWRRRSLGDLIVESAALALFLTLTAHPIARMFATQEAL